jgi:hypothetical protein
MTAGENDGRDSPVRQHCGKAGHTKFVMPAVVAGIHVFVSAKAKTWMAGS